MLILAFFIPALVTVDKAFSFVFIPFYRYSWVLATLVDRDYSNFSPKFSIGYAPGKWHYDFSLAQAYRYPIVGELFGDTIFSALGTTISNATLRPENAFNKAFIIRRDLEKGWVSLNFFENDVSDVIITQSVITPPSFARTTTFSNIDQARTRGATLDYHQNGFFLSQLDTVFNVTYTDSEILKNASDYTVVGNELPLLAKWRVNTLGTYHITENWDVAGGVHFATRAFSRLDNTDTLDMFGATTQQIMGDVKTSYRFKLLDHNLQSTFGINNINDYNAYDFHPYPQRTYFMQVKATF